MLNVKYTKHLDERYENTELEGRVGVTPTPILHRTRMNGLVPTKAGKHF